MVTLGWVKAHLTVYGFQELDELFLLNPPYSRSLAVFRPHFVFVFLAEPWSWADAKSWACGSVFALLLVRSV